MRNSHATWVLVAMIAATTCIHTGCGFSRLGKNVSSMSFERPRLIGWRKGRGDTEIASTTPRPPSSSIPPAGDSGTAGTDSRNFPSEPAPSGNYDYANTGTSGGNYGSTSGGSNYGNTGGYNDSYLAAGGRDGANRIANGGAQRGFYNPEYGSNAGGGSQYGDTGPGSGGYDNYGGSGARSYEQVADRRGDSSDNTYRGGSSYDNGGYGSDTYGNTSGGSNYGGSEQGSQFGGSNYGDTQGASYDSGANYGAQGGSRFVSPNSGGGNDYDTYRSPAQDSYDDTYGADRGYDSTYGGSAGANANGGSGAPSGATSPRWFPGSTKTTTPYNSQQQLAPPTNNGWGN